MIMEDAKVIENEVDNGTAEQKSIGELSRPSRDITFKSEVVTPKEARAMLRAAKNDHRDARAIDIYANEVRSGRWQENGQPIIFDENGYLIDGVQRLEAVVRADRPIATLIARNVRADTLHTIDQHRRRNYAGVLESRGYKDAGSIVRTMGRLIKIENGALNRHPLPVSWVRYDKVLDANPEILEALEISAEYPKSVLHSAARPVLAFQAIRAGKVDQLRSFFEELTPGHESEGMNAATQARILLSGWRNDSEIRVDVDKILGNATEAFNAYCAGKRLPEGSIWNPDMGRVRNAEGRWVKSDTVIRQDRAEGLTAKETAIAREEIEASTAELEAVARKLLQRTPGRHTDDDSYLMMKLPPRMDVTEFKEFLDARGRLGAKLEKEVRRRLVATAAPENLGLPVVDGYEGLREGRFEISANHRGGVEELTDEEREANAKLPTDIATGNVDARMVVITPELAERWLSEDINRGNRKIMKRHVKAIARDILNDHWMVNAQPICFTSDPFQPGNRPRLLNGQHRLGAVLEAGVPIEAPIAVNVAEEAFATFDVHAKKNIAMDEDKAKDPRVLAAAARFQWREDNGYKILESQMSPTASEILDTIDRHPGLNEHFPRSRRAGMVRLGSAGVLTYFFYRVSRDAPDLAPQFLDDLESGENLDKGNPVLAMREDLIVDRTRMTRKEALSRLLSTWESYKTWRRKSDGDDKPRLIAASEGESIIARDRRKKKEADEATKRGEEPDDFQEILDI